MANENKKGFSPVLAFILGFLLALIILVGAIVGVVVFALNYKLDKLSFNKDSEGNYIYINADPEGGGVGTALDLVKKVSGLVKDTSSLTLGTFEDTFPITSKVTNGVHDALEKYVDLDMEELKSKSFSELGNYLKDVLMDIRPADFISGNELADKILGDLTLGDIIDGKVDFESILNDIEITTLVDVNADNKIMVYLGYGVKSLKLEGGVYVGIYKLEDGTEKECRLETEGNKVTGAYYMDGEERVEVPATTVNTMNDRIENFQDELTLSDVIDIDENDRVMTKLGGYTISKMGDAIDDLTLDDFMDVEISYSGNEVNMPTSEVVLAYVAFGLNDIKVENGKFTATYTDAKTNVKSPAELTVEGNKITEVFVGGEKIKGTVVNDVDKRVEGITKDIEIGQLMDVTQNKILKALSHSTVDSLPTDIENMSINELYSEEIYKTDEGDAELKLATVYNEAYLYYEEVDDDYKLVKWGTADAGKLSASEFASGTYYTYGKANETWKLLLYETKDGHSTEKAYSVNSMDDLIVNVKTNVRRTSLYELEAAEIIKMDDKLDKVIIYQGELTYLGNLTLDQLLNFFVDIAPVAPVTP